MKVGKEIKARSSKITSKIISAAVVSKRTGGYSYAKISVCALLVLGVIVAPIQVSWGVAQAATQYDPVQLAQMWALVDAVESGKDTDPVHIAQALAFKAEQTAASSTTTTSSVAAPTQSATAVAPAVVIAPVAQTSINVWWPTAGVTVQGVQPLKAVAVDRDVSAYSMTWSVDGGPTYDMPTNTTDYPHKESSVDTAVWGAGAHTITYVAKDVAGNVIATQNMPITVQSAGAVAAPAPAPAPVESAAASVTISNSSFYVDPNSNAASQAKQWRSSRPGDAAKMDTLAAQPTAKWFGGWSGNIESAVRDYVNAAKSAGKVPVLVAYNIPQRDCGGYSAGGSNDYTSWIGAFARGIGSAKAVVILEPDSLALMDCLSNKDRDNRYKLLSGAVSVLKANGNTAVYLDAGHSKWLDPAQMASRLQKANVAKAEGFVTNTSNFMWTGDEAAYGKQLSDKLGGKHFVIDTSRNGNGPATDNQWCNPSGRAIGNKPTTSTGNGLIDAYLWIKTPGESDGNCNGGPGAGQWWPEYALSLVK